MRSRYDRIVWTVIALALAVIALNPWIAPIDSSAQSGTMRVNVAELGGHALDYGGPIPVIIVQKGR